MAKPLPVFVLLPQAKYFQFLDALKELEELKAARGGVGSSTAGELEASSNSSEVAEMGGGGIINDLPEKLNRAPADFNDTPPGPSEFVRKEVGDPKKKKREEQLEGQGATPREDHPVPWFYLGPGPFRHDS